MAIEREAQVHEEANSEADIAGRSSAPEAPADLLSSVSDMLAEHGRLAQIASEMKPAGVQDDEFGRFARQAIPFLDSLDRIVELGREQEHTKEFEGWLRSIDALNDRALRLFENYGLTLIDCLGENVDFSKHDVIEYRRTEDFPHNTVIKEIRKGVVFRGQTLRDAKVVVACNDDEAPSSS